MRSPLRPTTFVWMTLISQSAATMATPIRETTMMGWNCLAITPLSTPPRTSAGIAMPAMASSPSSTRPTRSARAIGRSSRRRVKRGSAARASARLTPGSSPAGGRASTLASSSGVGGMPASMPPPAPLFPRPPRAAAPMPRPIAVTEARASRLPVAPAGACGAASASAASSHREGVTVPAAGSRRTARSPRSGFSW